MAATAIKRVVPQFSNRMSFKAGETIEPGLAVQIASANTVTLAAVGTSANRGEIGYSLFNEAHAADEERTAFNPGEIVEIWMKNAPVQVNNNGAITVGHFMKIQSSGVYISNGLTKTVETTMIALEAATGTGTILALPI